MIAISFLYAVFILQVLGSTNGLLYVCDPAELADNDVCVFISSGSDSTFIPEEHNIDRTIGDDFYRQVNNAQGNKLNVSPMPWTNGDVLAASATEETDIDAWGYVLAFEMVAPLRDMMMYHPTELTTDAEKWAKWTKAFTDCQIKMETDGQVLNTDDVYYKMQNPNGIDIHHNVLQYLEEGAIDLVCIMTDLNMVNDAGDDHCEIIRSKWSGETHCDCFAAGYEGLYNSAPPTLANQFHTCTLTDDNGSDTDNTGDDDDDSVAGIALLTLVSMILALF